MIIGLLIANSNNKRNKLTTLGVAGVSILGSVVILHVYVFVDLISIIFSSDFCLFIVLSTQLIFITQDFQLKIHMINFLYFNSNICIFQILFRGNNAINFMRQ